MSARNGGNRCICEIAYDKALDRFWRVGVSETRHYSLECMPVEMAVATELRELVVDIPVVSAPVLGEDTSR